MPGDTLLLNEHFLLSMVHTQYEQPFVESNSTLKPTFYKNKFVFCFIFFRLNSLPNNCVPVQQHVSVPPTLLYHLVHRHVT